MQTRTPIPAALTALVLMAMPAVANTAAKPVGQLECQLTQFSVWQAPGINPLTGDGSVTAIRLFCDNVGKKSERIKRSDLILVDSDGEQFKPDANSDEVSAMYEGKLPTFIQHFLTVRQGQQLDLGVTFTADYDRHVDKGLVLDFKGTEFTRADAPPRKSKTAKPSKPRPVKLVTLEDAEAHAKGKGIVLTDRREKRLRGTGGIRTRMNVNTRRKTTTVTPMRHADYKAGALSVAILQFNGDHIAKKWGEVTTGDLIVKGRVGFVASGGAAADRRRVVEALK